MSTDPNNRRLRQILNEESPRARPMNGPWRRLERIGFQPDYSPADAGEAPKGAK